MANLPDGGESASGGWWGDYRDWDYDTYNPGTYTGGSWGFCPPYPYHPVHGAARSVPPGALEPCVSELHETPSQLSVKSARKTYHYSVQLINPLRKTKYSMHQLPSTDCFKSLQELREALGVIDGDVDTEQVGYVTPGHGLKGKKKWLETDDDLKMMYQDHKKGNITFFCYTRVSPELVEVGCPPGKRPKTDKTCGKESTSKASQKLTKVTQIVQELKEKHGPKYSLEQFNCWAHMIEMGKCDSYNDPPNLPFFGKRKQRESNTPGAQPEPNTTKNSQGMSMPTTTLEISPGKRVKMRGESISQINQWHDLLEKGAITLDEYSSLQKSILHDIHSNFKPN